MKLNTENWEFWHVAGNGYHMREKDSTHPTAMLNVAYTTVFYDITAPYTSFVDPEGKIKFEIPHLDTDNPLIKYKTMKAYDLFTDFWSLYAKIVQYWNSFRDEPLQTIVKEVQMLRYIDVIREYAYSYALKYGNTFPAMWWTSEELWFLAEGGMCKCGSTRDHHKTGKEYDPFRFHPFECDFSYGVSEETAQLLANEIKVPKHYNVEVP